MGLQEASERKVSAETSAQIGLHGACAAVPLSGKSSGWPKRVLERLKQGERVRACAYFLSTIL